MKLKRNEESANASQKKRDLTPSRARKEKAKGKMIDFYLRGHSMRAVVELINEDTGHNYALSTVHKYINEAVREWQENKNSIVEHHKAIEIEKINRLETTYWDGWMKSLEVLQTTTKTKTPGDGGRLKLSEESKQDRETAGDPRFLKGIEWCIEQRCKILGVDVPLVQINNNTTNSTSTTFIRKVVFKTRETTAQAQTIQLKNEN